MLNPNRGFTLIEILVSLVILAFGLLGIAGMMAKGQRASFEAFQRQQALSLANDMAERIRANSAQAASYPTGAPVTAALGAGVAYNDLLTGAITNCASSSCTPANLTAYDLALWDGLLFGYYERTTAAAGNLRVGGIINARGCIEETANTSATCGTTPSKTFTRTVRVSVAWQGVEETVAPVASTCGTGLYGTAAKRRLIPIDVMVIQQCP